MHQDTDLRHSQGVLAPGSELSLLPGIHFAECLRLPGR